jgi:hypothetical protein
MEKVYAAKPEILMIRRLGNSARKPDGIGGLLTGICGADVSIAMEY